jgi:multidrug efflux pump subunit AcrA (membrane-fusion protein)
MAAGTPQAAAGTRPSAAPNQTAGAPAEPVRVAAPGAGESVDFLKMSATALPAEVGTEEERERAKLPPPPEEDSQLQVLLRPGLLADVEITVEKIPNAIHIPAQAIFDKDGKPTVWVASGRRFQQREVKLARRSESTMVIADGLKPGEVIALADPYAKRGEKKGEKKAAPGVPGNAKGGG